MTARRAARIIPLLLIVALSDTALVHLSAQAQGTSPEKFFGFRMGA